MQRQALFCDFCGTPGVAHTFASGNESIGWYACAECAGLIRRERWNDIAERCLNAYKAIGPIAEDETILVLQEVWYRLFSFQAYHPVAA